MSLIDASKNGYFEIVMTLLSNGADLNLRGEYNRTALEWSSYLDREYASAVLRRGGGDIMYVAMAMNNKYKKIKDTIEIWQRTPRSLRFVVLQNIKNNIINNTLLLKYNSFNKETRCLNSKIGIF